MGEALENYKAFIDALVERKSTVKAKWITGNGYPKTKENEEINEFLSALSPSQKEILAKMVNSAHEAGIFTALSTMNELFETEGYALTKDGEELPYDTFDSMHYDFVCRSEGDDWPKEETEK